METHKSDAMIRIEEGVVVVLSTNPPARQKSEQGEYK
jgi:hypothetical protein